MPNAALPPSSVPVVPVDAPPALMDEEHGSPPSWKTVVAAKQAQLQVAMPSEWRIPVTLLAAVDLSLESTLSLDNTPLLRDCGILSDRELAITEQHTAVDLLAQLAAGTLTALEVTLAFSKRAAIAQQLVRAASSSFPLVPLLTGASFTA